MIWNTKLIDFVNENLHMGIKFLTVNPFYKGIESLKKSNLKYEHTPEEQELLYKYTSFMDFFKMMDEDLYKKVLTNDLAQTMNQQRFICCLHYRTDIFKKVVALKFLHDMTYNSKKTYVIISKIYDSCEIVVHYVKEYYKRMPFWLKRGIVAWNKKSIIFDNGCRLKSLIFSNDVGIGFSINGLLTCDMAHISDNMIQKFHKNMFPIMRANKEAYMYHLSTNKKTRSAFHDTVTDESNAYAKRIYTLNDDANYEGNRIELFNLTGEKIFDCEYNLEMPEKKKEIKKIKMYTVKLIDEDGKETSFQIPSAEDLKKEIKRLARNLNKPD